MLEGRPLKGYDLERLKEFLKSMDLDKSLEEYLVSPIRPIAFVAGKILAAAPTLGEPFAVL